MEGLENFLNRESRPANDAIGGTVVKSHGVTVYQVAVGKHDVPEKTGLFISSDRFHDWLC